MKGKGKEKEVLEKEESSTAEVDIGDVTIKMEVVPLRGSEPRTSEISVASSVEETLAHELTSPVSSNPFSPTSSRGSSEFSIAGQQEKRLEKLKRITKHLFRRRKGSGEDEDEILSPPTPNVQRRSLCIGSVHMVKVKGGEIEYEVKGEGEPIVLLRGLARTRRHWMGFDELLAQSFKVITINPRQMGGSTAAAPWTLTVEKMAEDVLCIMDDHELPKAHLLGVSLGGMVALALSMRHPDRVKSVCVCNVSVAENDFNLPRMTFSGFWTVAKEVMKGKKERGLANVMLSGVTQEERRYVEEEWNKIQKIDKVKTKVEFKHGFAAARFQCAQEDLRSIDVPALILYGTHDLLVPREHSLYVHEHIRHSKLVAIRQGGHEVTVDHPNEVRDELLAFVNDLPSHRLSQSYEKVGIKPPNWSEYHPGGAHPHQRRLSKYA